MDILITGGMGFVGLHLCEYLVKQDHKIIIYDNLSNSQIIRLDSNIQIIEGDILDYPLLSKSLKNIQTVIHLAAQISVTDSIKDPDNTIKVNVNGTKNLLNGCKENNIKNFIGISTAAVFGNQNTVLTAAAGRQDRKSLDRVKASRTPAPGVARRRAEGRLAMPPNGRKGPLAGGPPLGNVDFAGLDIERIPRQPHRTQVRPRRRRLHYKVLRMYKP